MTTALLLKRQGARVAVVEAGRVGTGATGNSTAKVTALQSTRYSTICASRSLEAAARYAAANRAAVEKVAQLAEDEHIDCHLHRCPAHTYATSDDESRMVEQEASAAAEAGLDVRQDDAVDLPFPVSASATLDGQLAFHPVRYIEGLAAAVHGDGSAVFEHSPADGVVEGSPCRVRAGNGAIRADRVVVATHYPVFDRGLYFSRLEAERSYCVAARVRQVPPQGLSINAGVPKRSTRAWGDRLVVCGESHTVGARDVDAGRYRQLEDFARAYWQVEEITHR